MSRTITALACTFATFAFAQLATAADSAKDTAQVRFAALDKDSDGKISLNEATEHDGLFVAFKNLDRDKDGMLTRDEFSHYRPDTR